MVLVLGLGGAMAPGIDVAHAADREVRFTVSAFVIEGPNQLGAAETDALLAPYLGEQLGFLGIRNAAQALEERHAAIGYPFHQIIIPPQKTASGSITLRVVPFKVNSVAVEGNSHFNDANILQSVPALTVGAVPDTRSLSRALEVANRNAGKTVGLNVKRSERPGHIDATLRVQDRNPHEVFLNANNRGTEETGEARMSIGYQNHNLWNRDHALTLTYTTSPGHWEDVSQYGLNYNVPLYDLAGQVSAFYTYSDVDSGTIAGVIDVSGEGEFAGVRYTQHLLGSGSYRHRVRFGIEDRLFDNNVDFQGTPIGVDVRSRPIGVDYTGEVVLANANYVFNVGYFRNTGSGEENSEQAYAASRAGADESFDVWRVSGSLDRKLESGFLLRARMRGQWADEPLISGEQFGLGGETSVRGFNDREVASDDGISGNVEVWLPPNRTRIDLLAFVDGGYGKRRETQPGETDELNLLSAGLGLRWRTNHLQASIDLGHVLDGAGDVSDGETRLHLNILARL